MGLDRVTGDIIFIVLILVRPVIIYLVLSQCEKIFGLRKDFDVEELISGWNLQVLS